MTIKISDLSIQMSDEVTSMLREVKSSSKNDNDDCFDIVVEERATVIICLQNLSYAWADKGKLLETKIFEELAPLVISLRGDAGSQDNTIADLQVKSAAVGWVFVNIETDNQDVILPVAQKIMEYIEEVV